MSSPASGALRLTRAAVLSGATVGLALAAHVLAGGAAPTAVGVGLLALPALALSLLVTAVRLSGPAVAAVVGTSQVALHLGLTALAAPTGVVGGTEAGHHLLHLTLGPAGPAGPAVGSAGAASWAALAMTATHVVAAGLVALLLTRGEQALWALLGWLVPRLPGAVSHPEPSTVEGVPAPGVVRAGGHARRPRSRAPPVAPVAVSVPCV